MTSLFTWMDHDEKQRQRMITGLNGLAEPGTVDELGIGAIRDTFADVLFPGTSVLHTRPRYLLFVPWLMRRAGHNAGTVRAAQRELRRLEIQLIYALLNGNGPDGVIGSTSKEKLVRMPSAVYWSALARFEIRRWDTTVEGTLRGQVNLRERRRREPEADDPGVLTDSRRDGFDPSLWEPPQGLLTSTTFDLSGSEAAYLRDRITSSPELSGSLMSWLLGRQSDDVDYVWQHPQLGSFPSELRRIVDHGRRFHSAIHGAVLLYNLMLAEQLSDAEDLSNKYHVELDRWFAELDRERPFDGWDRQDFWSTLRRHNPRISPRTQSFVGEWLKAIECGERPEGSTVLRKLIRSREHQLKGSRARLGNPKSLAEWTGASGLVRLSYRWRVAQAVLRDVNEALTPVGSTD